MKQTLNDRRQHAINLGYCYSAGRATQNMSSIRSLPTIAILVCVYRWSAFFVLLAQTALSVAIKPTFSNLLTIQLPLA